MRDVLIVIGVVVAAVGAAVAGAGLLTFYTFAIDRWFGPSAGIDFVALITVPTGAMIGGAIVLMGAGIWFDLAPCRAIAVMLVALPFLFAVYELFGVVDTRGVHLDYVLEILPAVITPVFVALAPRLARGYRAARGVVLEE
ncbi:hypothetical protein EON83_29890 [bacterium]|nr:MAG: hypothetical protein EON83_29890 [bacterium]